MKQDEDEDEREQLARTIYEAWSQGHLSDWEWVKRANCADGWFRAADAVVAFVRGSETVNAVTDPT